MFKYNGTNKDILQAVDDCNNLIQTNSFLTKIALKDHFDYADCTGRFISQMIEYFIQGKYGDLHVNVYKSKNPWSRAYGYFNPSKPDQIYLNSRKLNRSLASICASLCHELIHYLDSKSVFSFGHGDNSSVGKENSAPYWIDNLAEEILLVDKIEGSKANKFYTPWYYRLYNFIKWW
jgi:hypothetical protein